MVVIFIWILLVPFLMITGVLWDAYILTLIWSWYAVPIFHLPALELHNAVGVSCLVTLLARQYVPSKDGDTWGPLWYMYVGPLILLLIAYLAR
jgi:hypothetical protein